MEDIYLRLNLPKDTSREDLKSAFIAWKKSQQQILQSGTREEQAQASAMISEMTKLYKEACGISNSTSISKKVPTTSENSRINSDRNQSNVSDISSNASIADYEVNKQKILNIVLCAVIVVLSGTVLYLYDKKSPFVISTGILQNVFNRNENSNMTGNHASLSEKQPVTAVTPHTEDPLPQEKPQEKVAEKPIVEDINTGKNPAQREAIQTLLDFHENITKKSLRQAYDCMSNNLQNEISYEGWTPGFKNTVSSTPTKIKIISESPDKIVLSYDLTAIDNPGGTTTFAGTAVMIKTSSGWKIDDVINKIK